jgi:hypothetical protein
MSMLFPLFFNDAGRIVRHDAEVDFVAALQGALGGDPIATARFAVGGASQGLIIFCCVNWPLDG